MEFNVSKCYSLTVTLHKHKIRTNYGINEEMVENVNSYKYRGVYISSKMQWNETVDHMVSKAYSTLGLLKQTFSACSSGIMEKVYLSLVHPKLEYSCEVWSPSLMELKQRIEMVHRNAVHFVAENYNRRSSVTDMLGCLNWETLESCRTCLQLQVLHKTVTCQVALELSDYFQINHCRNLRKSHSKQLMQKFAWVDVVKNSFCYCVILKWNSLPMKQIQIPFLTYAKRTYQRINTCVYCSLYTFVLTSLLLHVFPMMMMMMMLHRREIIACQQIQTPLSMTSQRCGRKSKKPFHDRK